VAEDLQSWRSTLRRALAKVSLAAPAGAAAAAGGASPVALKSEGRGSSGSTMRFASAGRAGGASLQAVNGLHATGALAEAEPAATLEEDVALLREVNKKFRALLQKARCSAIVKLTGPHRHDDGAPQGSDDILMAHNSWEDYVEMLRIFKHYKFNFKIPSAHAQRASFSSYPGMLSSTDDFYMLSSGLAVAETTIDILEDSLLNKMCSVGGVSSWVRNLVANRVAKTGEEWVRIYSSHNAGTYNCQWMVVDYNMLKQAKLDKDSDDKEMILRPGTFWVVETIPGMRCVRSCIRSLYGFVGYSTYGCTHSTQ
jgi:hypothetical protein